MKLQDLIWNDMYEHIWNTLREKTDVTGQGHMAKQLRRRVDELPSEVVEMYKAMWQKNNRDHPVHVKQAAKILSMHKDFPVPFLQLAALVVPILVNHYSISQISIGEDTLDQICNMFLQRLP